LGDLLVREPLEVSEQQDLTVIVGEPRECLGEADLLLGLAGTRAGRGVGRGKDRAQLAGRFLERLFERDLAAGVTALRPLVAADLMRQNPRQDLAEPAQPLGLGPAPELRRGAVGFEQGLLNDVRRVELALPACFDLDPRQQPEPGPILR